MTPKRKKALQWFHDRGEVKCKVAFEEGPMTATMIRRLLSDGHLDAYTVRKDGKRVFVHALTDSGRAALHGAGQ